MTVKKFLVSSLFLSCLSVSALTVKPYFTPKYRTVEPVIVSLIDGAERELFVQAYQLTSDSICRAVERAKGRGCSVSVIVDKSQKSKPSVASLRSAGVNVHIDPVSGIAHNKVIVIDGKTTVTGSYNFSRNANERNAENILVVEDEETAEKYRENIRDRIQKAVAQEEQQKHAA